MSSRTLSPVLSIHEVSKSYGKLQALDDISFDVQPGEIFALLGPNGAGKTTLIGCITGLISQFEGRISVVGQDVRKRARVTRQLVGLVPQELNFDGFFSVEQVLEHQAGFYNVRPDKEKIHRILRDFGLYEKRKTNTRKLSGGMKRRLMICKALMHDPILLFLDEPTAGVDVELREELWRYVLELKKSGVTIFLTTHYLEEAEQLADRMGIINRGKLLMVKDREHILDEFGKRWNRFTMKTPLDEATRQSLADDRISFPNDHTIVLTSDISPERNNEIPVQSIIDCLNKNGHEILCIDGGRNSLESIFKEIVNADYEI
jgi:ABC-2 type transport system ATP-binding protein